MDQGKRTKGESGDRVEKEGKKIGGDFKVSQNPIYIQHRLDLVAPILERQNKLYENANKREI